MLFVILHKNKKTKKTQSEEAEILTFLKLDIRLLFYRGKKKI